MKTSFDRRTFIFGELGCILDMSFGFNYQVVNGLTAEKTEKTAEGHRDYSVSSAVKSWFSILCIEVKYYRWVD